jgi:type III secretion protein V
MRTMPMQRVIEVMRRLALEGVSLRYLREIYESLITWAPREKDTSMLCEYVRVDLGRFISNQFLDEERRLCVIVLDSVAEKNVRAAVQQGGSGAYLALAPDVLRELIDSVTASVATIPSNRAPVLLATIEIRRFLRRVLSQKLPQLTILSYNELPADVQIVQMGRISLSKTSSQQSVTKEALQSPSPDFKQ